METKLQYIPLIQEGEISTGERVYFEIDEKTVMLFRVGDAYFAVGDVCTHDDGPLGDSDLEGYELVCPRHGARFDIRDGKALCLPAVRPIPSYPVRIHEGMVEIGIQG
ncbi:MAG TPA: non-heme iron oxygenase ferredoxin subunit [Anaerolineaceae bacterium]|nr:non-heme iron oxygenase ferredoxin subunit [Anaerolineaceae bacterium]HPN53587.1 non-heme iron oxygenase ferredoxin subunit [Anaerolineaceae bacterium]